jgi:hypothetical protein
LRFEASGGNRLRLDNYRRALALEPKVGSSARLSLETLVS